MATSRSSRVCSLLRRTAPFLATAAFVGATAAPSFTPALFRSFDDEGLVREEVSDQFTRAKRDVARVRAQRRNYWSAVETYKELLKLGLISAHDLDIGDSETYARYLDARFVQDLLKGHASASQTPADADAPANAEEAAAETEAPDPEASLLERYRDLLDRYEDQGFCPASLKRYDVRALGDQNLYDLCQARLAKLPEKAERTRRTLQGTTIGRAAASLRERFKLIGDSLNRTRWATETGRRPSLRSTDR